MRPEPSLRERAVVAAAALRVAWPLVVALGIVALVASAIPLYERAHVACRAGCAFTPADLAALRASGVSLDAASAWGVGDLYGLALIWLAVAAFVYWKGSRTAIGVTTAYFLALVPIHFVLSARFANTAGWRWESLLEIALTGTGALFLFTFPDGHFRPGWTRWLWMVATVYFIPRTLLPFHALDGAFFPGLFVSGVAVQIYRYRWIAGPEERRQSRWVIASIAVAVLAGAAVSLPVLVGLQVHGAIQLAMATVVLVLLTLIPLSIAAALLHSQLWGVDVVLNRALLYSLLAALLSGLYIAMVASAAALFQRRFEPVFAALAAGAIALLFQPLHQRLQRGVNRLLHGSRDEPYAVITKLGRRTELAADPQAMLQAIVETVAATLRLPYVAIELDGTAPTSYGTQREASESWTLQHQQVALGKLVISPRRGEALSAIDRRLLADVATQLGVAVEVVVAQTALQKAREDLVVAREEERRRLRRDLHDGLGATLGALTLKAGSARSMLERDRPGTRRLLGEIEHDLQGAVAEVRRVVEGLRPAALDQRGLLAAVQDLAASCSSSNGGLDVTIDCNGTLEDLPAATELAAYRIVQEALTNAVRHSRARTCQVRLRKNRALRIEVSDDGSGLGSPAEAGVGITSMRQRAEELGGSFQMETRAGGGALIRASLPLR